MHIYQQRDKAYKPQTHIHATVAKWVAKIMQFVIIALTVQCFISHSRYIHSMHIYQQRDKAYKPQHILIKCMQNG